MQAGNHAMAEGMGIQAAAAMGVVSGGFASWAAKTHDHRARSLALPPRRLSGASGPRATVAVLVARAGSGGA